MSDKSTSDLASAIDDQIDAALKTGERYRIADRMVDRGRVQDLLEVRRMVRSEDLRRRGKVPFLASVDMSGAF